MKIFPTSPGGFAVLVLIAVILGLIWSMLQFPEFWRRLLKRTPKQQQQPPAKETLPK